MKTVKKDGRGGVRKNSGRKPLLPNQKRKTVYFYVTDEEAEELKKFAEELFKRTR